MKEGIHTLYEFFNSSRLYFIPPYQRNYAWVKEKQLKDFWDDFYYLDESKNYFLGTILLRRDQNIKDKSGLNEFEQWEIIDGQQRTITTSIFIKTALQLLKKRIDAGLTMELEFITRLKEEIVKKEKVFLREYELDKLIPLGDDKSFYKTYILEYKSYPDATLTPSQRRIKEARGFFEEKLEVLDHNQIISLLRKVENARLVIYPVEKRDDAVLIFETVNDRGKPLSDLEKVKSFLMYMVYLSSEEAYKIRERLSTGQYDKKQYDKAIHQINISENTLKQIQDIYGRVFRYLDEYEKASLKINEDDVLRYHYVLWSKANEGDYDESFKYFSNIKTHFRNLLIISRDNVISEVIAYSQELENVFYSLKEIFINLPKDKTHPEIFNTLNQIIQLGWLGNFYPLLVSCWLGLKSDIPNFYKILVFIEKYVFRVYLIGNKRSNAGVNNIYKMAYNFHKDKIQVKDLLDQIKKLASNYINNTDFETQIKSKNFYKNYYSREIRYIFYHYESDLRNHQGEPISLELENILSAEFSVEHILAQELSINDRPRELKNTKSWEEYLNKLGNLVLCSASWNSSLGKKRFDLKKKGDQYKKSKKGESSSCYKNSIFKSQQELTKYNMFSIKQIEERENKLFDFIKKKWSFN